MKSSNVWHGHSTRPSLPAGTVRKASGHLSGRGPSILLTQDRSVAQKPHWGFCCCANASLPWQAEQAHHANNEKQEVPSGGELPAVHIAIVCGFNRKFYKQCNSQQLVCDMQFTVVANESNRELRWQGASAGAHPVFVLYLIF
jgi:hypothetical protein